MGKAAKEKLTRSLNEHLNTIHETLQILDQTPGSSLKKVSWNEVIQMGEQISKQATTVGMLYTGEIPEVKVLKENMAAYFNMLQGFLLLSHGSSVGAGPTLSSCIHSSIKQVVDSSFMLLKDAVSSYGSNDKAKKVSIPQLVGTVWDVCSALKKTPSSNVMAIGRAMTQVAVSIKDVLREMKELKPSSFDPADKASDKVDIKAEERPDDDNDSCNEDLGNDLSPEEMKIAHLTTSVVSETLAFIKELVRSITRLLKQESVDGCAISTDSLEKLLMFSQKIGVQVDELGACLYPPQEISAIKAALEKISSFTCETELELGNLKGFSNDFVTACTDLRNSLKRLESELSCLGTSIVPEMENLDLSN
ncbi:cyclin-d1-binding 1 like [Olea europaea subsp. europaea]|uniref:Cyclin-d1-binding 1 like n=2 Tax=Olea europaea subsp. europaea TaxID=158383 RepID=A0A8S0V3S3_OLEEU|nr:cyclin-d1-binding 1 like [Olea europaea subsp. europaea]